MLTRRHLRIKVMQSIYAMSQQGNDNIEKQEKFLFYTIESAYELYLLILDIFLQIQQKEEEILQINSRKYLATKQDKNPNRKFTDNTFLTYLANQNQLLRALTDHAINNWKNNDDLILLLLKDIKNSELYSQYMEQQESNFSADKAFIIDLYTQIIAPNTKLYEYLEDYKISWIDDLPLINSLILMQLEKSKENKPFPLSKNVYKDVEDKQFAQTLFRKTVLNSESLQQNFENKTPNWDIERIAEIDIILLKMAIAEFFYFASIPTKVTLNEYIEIAKEYGTPNSSLFINGILDNLSKELIEAGKIQKIGRGLI